MFLRDSKTGPRTGLALLPGPPGPRRVAPAGKQGLPFRHRRLVPGTAGDESFWDRLRDEAGLEDVTLHDARHSYASVAMTQGETVVTIGKLLGHKNPATTLKYIHLDDAAAHEAVETVAPAMAGRG